MLNLALSIMLTIACLLLARVIVLSRMVKGVGLLLASICFVLLVLSMTALSVNLWRLTQL